MDVLRIGTHFCIGLPTLTEIFKWFSANWLSEARVEVEVEGDTPSSVAGGDGAMLCKRSTLVYSSQKEVPQNLPHQPVLITKSSDVLPQTLKVSWFPEIVN